jgi:hypothetical protein
VFGGFESVSRARLSKSQNYEVNPCHQYRGGSVAVDPSVRGKWISEESHGARCRLREVTKDGVDLDHLIQENTWQRSVCFIGKSL